jgi:isochorismate synthase
MIDTLQPATSGGIRLWTQITEGQRRAQRLRRPILVSITASIASCDPLAIYDGGGELHPERQFWACPSLGYELAGIGAAWSVSASGAERFRIARQAWSTLLADALLDDTTDAIGTGPLLLGGFAFDPQHPTTAQWGAFPDALLTLPRYAVTRVDQRSWLTVNLVIEPDSQHDADDLLAPIGALIERAAEEYRAAPIAHELSQHDVLPAAEWKSIVRDAITRLQYHDETAIEKVVLAREVRVRASRTLSRTAALARLRADYPGCFIFAIDRGAECFLGASPERLIRLQHGHMLSTCLAGSIARGITPDEDARLEAELLASAKDRHEHAVVVRGLRDGLIALTEQLTVPDQPTILKVRNVQHLYTPVTGRAAPGVTVLDLVERLHPTPAVGGLPRAAALAIIRETERMHRGWYAGPVGWMDARGNGEFAVALRCGLLRDSDASLFAGCGIMADSDPEREYAESSLKLRPIISALGGGR